MAEQERSPLLTQQDPMLASSSSKEDQLTSLEASHENVHLLESETALLLEEFSEKSVEFKVKLDITGKGDSYEISDALNRIYTSTDRSITFDIVYKSEHGSNLSVRIMLVGSNLLHHPLARCSYHRKGDNTTFKDHVVRHMDASAEYVGTATGMLYPERLAILVPLDQSGLKSITLDFVCLNSCHKIRKLKLALVFTLEDQDDKKNRRPSNISSTSFEKLQTRHGSGRKRSTFKTSCDRTARRYRISEQAIASRAINLSSTFVVQDSSSTQHGRAARFHRDEFKFATQCCARVSTIL